jgi:predicted esterase
MLHRPSSALGRTMLLIVCLSAFVSHAVAQSYIGRQKVDQYQVNGWNSQTYGLTWLPDDYDQNPNKKYPLIIFLHGAGETGTSVGSLWGLISTALPQRIAQGWNPEATNPVDGQKYKFIVISPQAPSWSYSWGHIRYMLWDVQNRYRVDTSRVYVTGLSAGGAGTLSCYLSGFEAAQKYAAIVPICPAGTNNPAEAANLPYLGGNYGGKIWTICGANDSWMSFSNSLTQTINTATPAPQVPALVSAIPGAGHDPSAWNTAYDPNWRSNAQGLNVYEWMLKYTRSGGGGTTTPVTTTPTPTPTPVAAGRIEAENYAAMSGIQTEGTSDVGGGQNVGWMDNGDWMDYSVNVSAAGTYNINFRVASLYNGAQFQVRNAAGSVLTTVTVPNTGGFQNWQTITAQASLPAGVQTLRIYTSRANGGWNLNWWEIGSQSSIVTQPPVSSSSRIEAEAYAAMYGVRTESTADAGGGENIAWQDNGDWMDYAINVSTAGTYAMNFRVATMFTGAQFQVRNAAGTVLSTITVPNTGSFQSWQTTTANVALAAGQQTIRIYTSNASGGWNLNWLETGNITSTTPPPPPPPSGATTRIEAENYSSMLGIQKEGCADAGGGENIAWQDNGDWMDYTVSASAAGTYTINFRVATMFTGPRFQVRNSAGTVLATVNVPNTGGFQNWQTVSASVALVTGQQTIRIYTSNASGGWNLNWLEMGASTGGTVSTNPSPVTSRIEAENYTAMSGIQKESTSDAGGGENVAWQDTGDWMDYAVPVSAAGDYTLTFRVATQFTGASFQVRDATGTVLATVTVPNTGDFQSWQNVSAQVNLPAGNQTLRIYTSNDAGGWNLNWFEISESSTATIGSLTNGRTTTTTDPAVSVFPNPVQDRFALTVDNDQTGTMRVDIVSLQGLPVKSFQLQKTSAGAAQFYLSVGTISQGNYLLKVTMQNWTSSAQLVKE